MSDDDQHAPLIFELSWEACAQTGGIYTVLRSKCAAGMEACGDEYYLVSPYQEASARIEFEAEQAAEPVSGAVAALRERGVVLHTGRWVITGHPRVVLVDLRSVARFLPEMKYFLWHDLRIASSGEDRECDEVVSFGYVAADLLAEVASRAGHRPVVAQFHEWQSALGIPILRHRQVPVATVFTTHATLVGRCMSAAGEDLYGKLNALQPQTAAREHGIERRYLIERGAAQAADVFTTVSGITAQEAEVFLSRKPELVLPNGLNVQRFVAPHEFQNLHQQYKETIHEFVMGHFFPSYTLDLDQTLYVFTAGRYEYRNKGMDVFIDALHELNIRLKAESYKGVIVAFIVTPAPVRGMNLETLNRQVMLTELRTTCEQIAEAMERKLFRTVTLGRLPAIDDLLDEYGRVRLQRMIHAWRRESQPTIFTHDLADDAGDLILNHLRRVKLLNARDDPVKVVFHPEFITATSPILGVEYDHFVRGCNMGVFPSYYEPWGYTPMECIVRGVPGITSDQSGFGMLLMDNYPDHDANGMYVCRRRGVPYRNIVYQVAAWLHEMTRMSLRERIQLRNRVEEHAENFDWSRMFKYYRAARSMALRKQRESRCRECP